MGQSRVASTHWRWHVPSAPQYIPTLQSLFSSHLNALAFAHAPTRSVTSAVATALHVKKRAATGFLVDMLDRNDVALREAEKNLERVDLRHTAHIEDVVDGRDAVNE